MRSHDDFDPGLREFHPDFGYLYPSRRLRSRVRLALSAAIFGILVGAIGATLVSSGRSARDPARTETALTLRPVSPGAAPQSTTTPGDAPPTATPGDAPPTATPGDAPPTATPGDAPQTATPADASPMLTPIDAAPAPGKPESPPAATDGQPARVSPRLAKTNPADSSIEKPCTEETWPYFDSQCLWGPGKEQSAPASAAKAPAGAARRAPVAAVEAPVASEPRSATPKKKTKTVAARPRREAADSRRAYARRNAPANFGFWGNAYARSYEPRREWRGWSW